MAGFVIEIAALGHGGPVFAEGEFAGFVDGLLEVAFDFAVVVGDGGVGGEEKGVGEVVAFDEAGGLEVDDGADEDEALEGNAAFDQVAREAGGPGGAVAFSGQVEGGGPA